MPHLQEANGTDKRRWVYRHGVVVRVTHWINVICVIGLLMSGLQIFNAHPALYWGKQSDFKNPIVEMKSGGDEGARGVTTVFGKSFDTTGVLGVSAGPDGENIERGFPSWSTLPGPQDLATGRRWHFFYAWLLVINGAVYLVSGLVNRHFARDLAPSAPELRHVGRSIVDHLRLSFPKGDEARYYNVLQKLSYLFVIFILFPLIVLAGWAMSPALNTAVPELLTLMGGRQSARTIHFVAATGIVLFVLVHVVMVLISGVWNNLRSMITGRYDIGTSSDIHAKKTN